MYINGRSNTSSHFNQSMHKPLPIWFLSWSFSSLQPHWIGGDRHNGALVLFVGLQNFPALLVQRNRSPVAVREILNPGMSSHTFFATVVASGHLQGQASTCPEKVSKMTRTYSKWEHLDILNKVNLKTYKWSPRFKVRSYARLHLLSYIIMLKPCPKFMNIQE